MRVILCLIADDPEIDHRCKHLDSRLKDDVVEQRQPGSLSVSKPRDCVVDSAHRQWLAHRQKRSEQIPVVHTKSGRSEPGSGRRSVYRRSVWQTSTSCGSGVVSTPTAIITRCSSQPLQTLRSTPTLKRSSSGTS